MNQRSASASGKKPVRVPKIEFDALLSEMNRQQRSFYQRYFLPGLLAGDPVDVQGESGYGEALLRELLEERRADPLQALRTLEKLRSAYSGAGRSLSVSYALSDFYFLEGDFAAGYAALGSFITPSHHLTLASHLDHPPLTALQVFRWGEGAITRKGIQLHLHTIITGLQDRLDEYHAAHGASMLEIFWQRITSDLPIDDVVESIQDEVALRFTGRDARAFLEDARSSPSASEPLEAFHQWPGYEEPIDWPTGWVCWMQYGALVFSFFRNLLRDAENAARDEAGVPRVGQGWISETTLLRQIQEAFPTERVQHQARPGWLAPQSLDIYLPDHNIGIEYQGAQHSAPIPYFGGAENFEVQQERDARKRAACNQNGCTLIEVHPGYQLATVAAQLESAILHAKQAPP